MTGETARPGSIGFVGFGEAARAFASTLSAHLPDLKFAAYDILLDREPAERGIEQSMAKHGVEIARRPAGLSLCDWIISAVTADQSLPAAESLAPHLRPGQVYVDINSVSPGRKKASAAIVEKSGAAYLDMAVMAPVHPRGHRTPVLVAGPHARTLAPVLAELDFAYAIAGERCGQATAIKMVRSLFVKGLEAITVETLLAARESGCFDEIYTSLSRDFEGLGWPEFAAYEFERTMRHGRRRAAEMRECAITMDELGLSGALAVEIARIQEIMSDISAVPPDRGKLAETIGAVLDARRDRQR